MLRALKSAKIVKKKRVKKKQEIKPRDEARPEAASRTTKAHGLGAHLAPINSKELSFRGPTQGWALPDLMLH